MPAARFAAAMGRILTQTGRPAKIVSALSGGLDSVTLLHLLRDWQKSGNSSIPVVAAHLNHGLRGSDADRDLAFSRDLAIALNVSFAADAVDVRAAAESHAMGLEEAGRLLRYRFLHRVGGDNALVLTGHHADDQAETILLNLRRGAHRRGLSGMRELALVPAAEDIMVRVGRPLLTVPRETLHAFARANGWKWREDASNADTVYRRNRLRHRVIPILEKLMPGFRERLLARAERTAAVEEDRERRGRELAEAATRHEGGGRFFRIDAGNTGDMADGELLLYAFRHVVEEELGGRLSGGAVLARLAALAGSGRPGETLTLSPGLRVRREPDGLFFFSPGAAGGDADGGVILPEPPFSIRVHGLVIDAAWVDYAGAIPGADRADARVQWLDASALRLPLCLRPPCVGERFRPLGAPGARKIQDILVDAKVPRRQRSFPRVVADSCGAVWLWPIRLADRVRLGDEPGRALWLSVREAEGGAGE